jgi:hypothetical protein
MPGLDPGIHEFQLAKKNVDGRDKPGHDEMRCRGSDLRGVLVSAAFLFSNLPLEGGPASRAPHRGARNAGVGGVALKWQTYRARRSSGERKLRWTSHEGQAPHPARKRAPTSLEGEV